MTGNKITTVDDLYEVIDAFFSKDFDLSKELYRENIQAADWLFNEIGNELIKVLRLKRNVCIKNLINSDAKNSEELAQAVINFILKEWYADF